MTRSALVTGGAGFIGSNVVASLLEQGFRVRVFDDLSSGDARNLDGCPVELIRGDVRDDAAVAAALRGVDAVFHLAASVGNARSLADPRHDAEVNAIGTLLVAQAAADAGVSHLVYSSSAAIFGELRSEVIAEDHPLDPVSPYGVSKLAGEKYALAVGQASGMTVACLRYFNVYGAHQRYDPYGNVIPTFVHHLRTRACLTIDGDGEQTRDFVEVRDVARANVLAATRLASSGVFNVGSGSSITINDLASLVEQASGLAARRINGPARPGDVRHSRADVSRLREQLGFAPDVELRQGLADYFAWLAREESHDGATR